MSILSKEVLALECAKLKSSDLDVLHDGETGLEFDRMHLADEHQPAFGAPDTDSIIETLNSIEDVATATEFRNQITETSSTVTAGDRTGHPRTH